MRRKIPLGEGSKARATPGTKPSSGIKLVCTLKHEMTAEETRGEKKGGGAPKNRALQPQAGFRVHCQCGGEPLKAVKSRKPSY